MQILSGELVHELSENRLPVPRHLRESIGLQPDAEVFVAFLRASSRPVCDVVISARDPDLWRGTTRVSYLTSSPDLSHNLEAIGPLRMVLAEVTAVNGQAAFAVQLVVQWAKPRPQDDNEARDTEISVHLARLRRRLAADGCTSVRTSSVEIDQTAVEAVLRGRVDGDWVVLNDDWRQTIRRLYPVGITQVDLDAGAVVANTLYESLRVVFPTQGAQTARVQFRAAPGAMAAVIDGLRQENLNILSFLIRRGAMPGTDEILAIVEPQMLPPSRDDADMIDTEPLRMLEVLVTDLRRGLDENTWQLEAERFAELDILTKILELQLISPNPRRSLVRGVLKIIGAVATGVAGNVVYAKLSRQL